MNKKFTTRFGLIDLALLLTASVWGINVVIVKIALRSFSPIIFNSLRFILAMSLSWIMLHMTEPRARVRRSDFFTLVWLGLLGHALYQVLFIYGINFTSAGNTSLLLAAMPVWVAIFSALTAVDTVRLSTWLGLACSVLGILFVVLGSGKDVGFALATLKGDLMILCGTLLYATFTIRSKPLMSHYSPLQVSTYTMTSGTLGLTLLAIPTLLSTDLTAVSTTAWAALAFSGVFAIVLGYFVWNSGVKLLGPARTAVYSNLSPVVAMLTGWAMLNESLSLQQILGAICIIVGLMIARLSTGQVTSTTASVTETQ